MKWLHRITLQEQPSDNYFQARPIASSPHVRRETVRWEEGLMLGELPVNCVITIRVLRYGGAGMVEVRGVALVGGGRTIARVDLSSDVWRNWTSAELGEITARGPGASGKAGWR